MSKPVTDVEIEDVLSSIRRLVTQGERTPALRDDAADRLVLTPSLRVAGAQNAGAAEPDETLATSAPEEEPEPAPAADSDDGERAVSNPLDLTAFRAQRALLGQAAEPVEEEEDDEPSTDVDALLARLAEDGPEAEEETGDAPVGEGTAAEVARLVAAEDDPAADLVPEDGFTDDAGSVEALDAHAIKPSDGVGHAKAQPAEERTEEGDDEIESEMTAAFSRWSRTATEDDTGDDAEESANHEQDPLVFSHRNDEDLDEGPAATGAGVPRDVEGEGEAASRPTLLEPAFRSDRVALETTIAELEAAVRDEETFEPDGSERSPVMDWSTAETSAGFFTSRLRHRVAGEDDSSQPGNLPDDAGTDVAEPDEAAPAAAGLQLDETPAAAGEDHDDPAEADQAIPEEQAADDTAESGPMLLSASDMMEPSQPDPAEVAASDASAPAAAWTEEESENAVLSADSVADADPVEETETADPAPGEISISLPDAELLRQIVAEVLREELAGELGTRITGNVRRLVRREVSRALNTDTPLD